MKDNFSSQSDHYARFRPAYPPEFYDYLKTLVPNRKIAWDCGTGNGQAAVELAKSFERVFATDISASQIANAFQADNIIYSVQAAEQTRFDDQFFDLIIAAQAVHWFDLDKFYAEVRRTAKKSAKLCLMGYGRISVSPQIDDIIENFYTNTIGAYWDKERRFIETKYETLPFPFNRIETPEFEIQFAWDLEHLIGYLNTWSAVKHFISRNPYNPVENLLHEIQSHWQPGAIRNVNFPMFLKIGNIHDRD